MAQDPEAQNQELADYDDEDQDQFGDEQQNTNEEQNDDDDEQPKFSTVFLTPQIRIIYILSPKNKKHTEVLMQH